MKPQRVKSDKNSCVEQKPSKWKG